MKSNNNKRTKKISRNRLYDAEETKNYNDDREDEDEDKEYCIPSCLVGRKYQEANDLMIGCDDCENWYHPKCIKMTDDEFEIVKNSDWICTDCKNK